MIKINGSFLPGLIFYFKIGPLIFVLISMDKKPNQARQGISEDARKIAFAFNSFFDPPSTNRTSYQLCGLD